MRALSVCEAGPTADLLSDGLTRTASLATTHSRLQPYMPLFIPVVIGRSTSDPGPNTGAILRSGPTVTPSGRAPVMEL